MSDNEAAAKALEDAADYYKRQLGTVGAFDIPLHPRDFAPWLRNRAARTRLNTASPIADDGGPCAACGHYRDTPNHHYGCPRPAPCRCGHFRDYHGNADGQTGWQERCGHPECDCENFDEALQ